MNECKSQVNDCYKYIILKCLEFNPNKRISLDKLFDLLEIADNSS